MINRVEGLRVSHPMLLFLLLLFPYFTQNMAHAQYFTGAVATSMGGAGRAAAEPSETVLLNPATIVHGPSLSAGLFYSHGENLAAETINDLGFNVVDNSEESYFPGALSYIKRHRVLAPGQSVEEHFGAVSVGGFVFKQIALGASLIRLEQREEATGMKYEQWNGTLGLHHSPTANFAWAAVYTNVGPTKRANVPDHLELVPRVSLGAAYLFNDLVRVRLDISRDERLNPAKKMIFQGGVESFVHRFVVARVGAGRDDNLEKSWISAGLSFSGPRFKLDYGYSIEDGSGHEALHGVDLRLPF